MNSAAGFASHWGDPHRQAHVRQASGPQIGQPARRAAEFLRQLRPGKTALLALLVERRVELVQVPPEPAARSWLRQLDVAHVGDRTGEELLRCPAEPAEHAYACLGQRSSPRLLSSGIW